jgi:hypothetical protein
LNNPDNISTIKYIFNINQLKIIYEKLEFCDFQYFLKVFYTHYFKGPHGTFLSKRIFFSFEGNQIPVPYHHQVLVPTLQRTSAEEHMLPGQPLSLPLKHPLMLLYQEEDRHGKKMSMRTSIVHMYQKV